MTIPRLPQGCRIEKLRILPSPKLQELLEHSAIIICVLMSIFKSRLHQIAP
jgi:hypothetical protein